MVSTNSFSLPSVPAQSSSTFKFASTPATTMTAFGAGAPSAAIPTLGSSLATSSFVFNPNATLASSFALPNSNPFAPPSAGGGFGGGFGGFGAPPVAPTAALHESGGGEDGDDEGEPILEPEKVLRNDADTDDILLEVPCKLFGFSKDSNEWKDTGKGSFRVTRNIDTNKQRMLVRNPIGKLTFNAGFYKGMKIEMVKGGLRFSAFVAADEAVVGGSSGPGKVELKNFMIKLKDADIANAMANLEAGVASCT